MAYGMHPSRRPLRSFLLTLLALVAALVFWVLPPTEAHSESGPVHKPLVEGPAAPPAPARQTEAQAQAKSVGCEGCHSYRRPPATRW
jgi:hypothetical protein